MVMKKKAMGKNIRRTIKNSLGRYIAIVAIIALGTSMFVGLVGTKTDMVATAQKFTEQTNMFDLRLLCSYGWSSEDVEQVAQMDGVAMAEGTFSMDVFGELGIGAFGGSDEDAEAVYRLHSIPEKINRVNLLGGRMPQSSNECLVDGSNADDSVLGKEFVVTGRNDPDTLENIRHTTYTVVGYVSTPIYMDVSRGSTTLGSGQLDNYVYLPKDAFAVDYYTEICLTLPGVYDVYSQEHIDAMEDLAQRLEPGVIVLGDSRLDSVKEDVLADYYTGLQEYEDGLSEYETQRQEALEQLGQALQELQDGQAELDQGLLDLDAGKEELAAAEAELADKEAELSQLWQESADNRQQVKDQLWQTESTLLQNQQEVAAGLHSARDGISQLQAGIAQLEAGIAEIDNAIVDLDGNIEGQRQYIQLLTQQLESGQGDMEAVQAELAGANATLVQLEQGKVSLEGEKGTLSAQLADLQAQLTQLQQTEQTLIASEAAIVQGFADLEAAKTQAQEQIDAAEQQLLDAQNQLAQGKIELGNQWQSWTDAKQELEDAQTQLDQGWLDYEQAKADAEQEFTDAEAELADAKAKLDDAYAQVQDMEEAEVYILNRNTNIGYMAVDSNSDIVAGVSRVFPAFFLLVAALVCITTMTRMVDEERTQIGVLKAMGYGNGRIIGKYLVYTGSAAVLGCTVGVIAGSVVFPIILWKAYSIILNLTPDIVLKLNWPLCIAVVASYTVISMAVTWYCCRCALREAPAELIRPKAPVAGKKILLEYLPFWNRIGFLNKVMFRNVFRYKQRLLMMLVGIGGCTALLLTGFGIGDSIQDIVDYQFDEVTVYDMEVYFSEGMTKEDQALFAKDSGAGKTLFFHQRSVTLDYAGKSRDVYLIAPQDSLEGFIDLHSDGEKISGPNPGEVILSVGAAEAMGVHAGDEITVRDSDMNTMEVIVSHIYDNHVHNYMIVHPQTLTDVWGEALSCQMAYVNAKPGQDVHQLGAAISGMEGVMNVSVCQEVANRVGSMLEAMDLIVLTIVVCAGMLAGIVLYNLTNISITERIREIATIKVLGFTSRETAAYVFKENLFLSAMGAVLGLGGGVLLLKFVMSQIKIDMVWFQARMEPLSFLWAVVLTMVSACVVDFVLYFKLERINMAEALKSVE